MANGKPILKFIESWKEPGDVFVASFRPLTGFEWEPGQVVEMEMTDVEAHPEQGRRTFSIASEPNEEIVLLATVGRLGGAPRGMQAALEELEAGDEVHVTGPVGEFKLVEDPRVAHVFLALGEGAGLIRGLARHAAIRMLNTPVHVVQTPADGGYPFEEDLRHLGDGYDNVHYAKEPTPPRSRDALADAAGGSLEEARFYVAGPVAEVDAVRRVLAEAGVPAHRVSVAAFTGYD